MRQVPHYPASYDIPNVLSVAATDSADTLASLPGWGSNYGVETVDVAALKAAAGVTFSIPIGIGLVLIRCIWTIITDVAMAVNI